MSYRVYTVYRHVDHIDILCGTTCALSKRFTCYLHVYRHDTCIYDMTHSHTLHKSMRRGLVNMCTVCEETLDKVLQTLAMACPNVWTLDITQYMQLTLQMSLRHYTCLIYMSSYMCNACVNRHYTCLLDIYNTHTLHIIQLCGRQTLHMSLIHI